MRTSTNTGPARAQVPRRHQTSRRKRTRMMDVYKRQAPNKTRTQTDHEPVHAKNPTTEQISKPNSIRPWSAFTNAPKSEASYNASQFIQMVSELGGFETARILLASSDISDGFTALWEARRLDLTVEALVLGAQWTGLFTAEERHTAEDRLRQYEYKND